MKRAMRAAAILAWSLAMLCVACAIGALMAGMATTGVVNILFAGVCAANAIGIQERARKSES